ncbi:MAG TPA: 2-phospho-L-lactate transferase CofD family protein, partial [Candidatus Polarisedimenticolaceae bacterium]|nr:2-phospho-L-lactate transferase CofD family protein [Candidatus Polarisedimenticolaceae bacterium]
TLRAELGDGSWAEGESHIAQRGRPIRRVQLVPADARALPEALEALGRADVIVLGPGSLYTSLLPVLMVREIGAALARTQAQVVLVLNLMWEPGETAGYRASTFLRVLREHVPGLGVDELLVNTTAPSRETLERYAAQGVGPVDVDPPAVHRLGSGVVGCDLLAAGPKIRHDPDKTARALVALATCLCSSAA